MNHPIFKPKTGQDADRWIKRQSEMNEVMQEVFCDLYKDKMNKYLFVNNENEWMFEQDISRGFLCVSRDRIWDVFDKKFKIDYQYIKEFIEDWLKQNTDWPHLTVVCTLLKSRDRTDL